MADGVYYPPLPSQPSQDANVDPTPLFDTSGHTLDWLTALFGTNPFTPAEPTTTKGGKRGEPGGEAIPGDPGGALYQLFVGSAKPGDDPAQLVDDGLGLVQKYLIKAATELGDNFDATLGQDSGATILADIQALWAQPQIQALAINEKGTGLDTAITKALFAKDKKYYDKTATKKQLTKAQAEAKLLGMSYDDFIMQQAARTLRDQQHTDFQRTHEGIYKLLGEYLGLGPWQVDEKMVNDVARHGTDAQQWEDYIRSLSSHLAGYNLGVYHDVHATADKASQAEYGFATNDAIVKQILDSGEYNAKDVAFFYQQLPFKPGQGGPPPQFFNQLFTAANERTQALWGQTPHPAELQAIAQAGGYQPGGEVSRSLNWTAIATQFYGTYPQPHPDTGRSLSVTVADYPTMMELANASKFGGHATPEEIERFHAEFQGTELSPQQYLHALDQLAPLSFRLANRPPSMQEIVNLNREPPGKQMQYFRDLPHEQYPELSNGQMVDAHGRAQFYSQQHLGRDPFWSEAHYFHQGGLGPQQIDQHYYQVVRENELRDSAAGQGALAGTTGPSPTRRFSFGLPVAPAPIGEPGKPAVQPWHGRYSAGGATGPAEPPAQNGP